MVASLTALWLASAAAADNLRIAYFHTELSRDGPGQLVRALRSGKDPQVTAVVDVIAANGPDILVLSGLDYDAGGAALSKLAAALSASGLAYSDRFWAAPNTGLPLGEDGSRRAGGGQSYGAFRGQGAMAVLSRFDLLEDQLRSMTEERWSAFPWADPIAQSDDVHPQQRLSTHVHWVLPVDVGRAAPLTLLILHASPPVFDGPEDLNGRRNSDELRLWAELLSGEGAPEHPVIIGTLNADPEDGERRVEGISTLLSHPSLQDPEPHSRGGSVAATEQGGVNGAQKGDPRHDTVDWPDDRADAPGNLRVDYILPAANLTVADAGVVWPTGGDGLAQVEAASRHRLIWVDLDLP